MDWINLNIKAKEVFYLLSFVITMTLTASSVNNKVDSLSTTVLELKQNQKETDGKKDVLIQNIQNQVNQNSVQIKLMQQDIEMIKQGYYK